MSKSVTVNFDDGSSHTYDNVPDDVSDDQVTERANGEFSNKTISTIGSGQPTSRPPEVTPPLDTGTALLGGAQTAYNVANEVLGSPLGHAVGYGVGAAYGAKQLKDYLNAKQAIQAAAQEPIGTPRGPATKIPVNWNPGATPAVPTSMNQLPVSARNIPVPTNPNLPTVANPNLPAVNRIDQIRAVANAPAPAPAIGGPAAQEGSNFIERIAQKYAPIAQRVAPILNNPVTRALTGPVGQAAQGMLYSPGLNTNEDEELRRRRAMAATIR